MLTVIIWTQLCVIVELLSAVCLMLRYCGIAEHYFCSFYQTLNPTLSIITWQYGAACSVQG
jgi:hypothetical protein